jgi:hypothetical protein
MRTVILLSLLIGSFGCTPEQPIVEPQPLVGNTYLVQTIDGQDLFMWEFNKNGTVNELNIQTNVFYGGGLYEFKWDGGIKTVLILTAGLNEQKQFAINDDNLSEIYLTNLKDFSIFVLYEQK